MGAVHVTAQAYVTAQARRATGSRARRTRLAALVLTPAFALALASCEPQRAAAPSWPAGTVLALDGAPITQDEVDAIAAVVARIEPMWSTPHLRRIALTRVVLPRAAARNLAGTGRDAALAAARAWRSARDAHGPEAATPDGARATVGGPLDLGLETWDWAIDAPDGAWSEPIEVAGAWQVARVVRRTHADRPGAVTLEAEVASFPWIAAANVPLEIEQALDRSELVFVEPAWRDLVPTLWQRRLRGGNPG
jgi:hypothetical protein